MNAGSDSFNTTGPTAQKEILEKKNKMCLLAVLCLYHALTWHLLGFIILYYACLCSTILVSHYTMLLTLTFIGSGFLKGLKKRKTTTLHTRYCVTVELVFPVFIFPQPTYPTTMQQDYFLYCWYSSRIPMKHYTSAP